MLTHLRSSPALWLATGIALGFWIQLARTKSASKVLHLDFGLYAKKLLPASVVFLGASLNFMVVIRTGAQSIASTAIQIALVLGLGLVLSRLLKFSRNQALLISVGTAICGGSAIAAVGPVIAATSAELALALAVVFSLNAVGLVLFPPIGHWLNLSQAQFGTWAALAIHDTSSVVGASATFGEVALAVGTLLKLVRALWIAPVAILIAWVLHRRGAGAKKKIPFPKFVLGFLVMSALFSFIPALEPVKTLCVETGRWGLLGSLLLIGLSVDLKKFRELGIRAAVYSLVLWIASAGISLFYVLRVSSIQ